MPSWARPTPLNIWITGVVGLGWARTKGNFPTRTHAIKKLNREDPQDHARENPQMRSRCLYPPDLPAQRHERNRAGCHAGTGDPCMAFGFTGQTDISEVHRIDCCARSGRQAGLLIAVGTDPEKIGRRGGSAARCWFKSTFRRRKRRSSVIFGRRAIAARYILCLTILCWGQSRHQHWITMS